MEIKEKKSSNKVINYIQEAIKKIAFNNQKRKINKTNLSEKEKFVYFHKNLRKSFLAVSLEDVHHYYEYGNGLSKEDKIDILVNDPGLSKYLKEPDDNLDEIFKQVVLELLKKNSDKDVYLKLKNINSKIKDSFLKKEFFKKEWISFLDEKDLFLFSEEVLDNIGDIRGSINSVFLLLRNNKNTTMSFLEHSLKESVENGYLRHKDLLLIYKGVFGDKINSDIGKNLENIIKVFLKTEDRLNTKYSVYKTFAGVYLVDALIYKLEHVRDLCMERLDLMLKNECSEDDYKNNYMAHVDAPIYLLKRNVKYLHLFSYYSFKDDEIDIFNYLKELNNDEFMYIFLKKVLTNTASLLVSKENLDFVISYRNKINDKSFFKKNIHEVEDIKNITGFENYYEIFKYFAENKLIDIDTRESSVKALIYFSTLEENIDNKLKLKNLFLKKLDNQLNYLKKDELLNLIFIDLNSVPKNNDDYKEIKKMILNLSFINEDIIKEKENVVESKKTLTVSELKDFLNEKTFKEVDAFSFIDQMLSLGVAESLNLDDENDLRLIVKSLYVNQKFFKKRSSELVSNKKFIEIYFDEVAKSNLSISGLLMGELDKNLIEIKHIEKTLDGCNNDVWYIKNFKDAPCVKTKEFNEFIRNHLLTKGLNLKGVKNYKFLNDILTKQVLNEALNTQNGCSSLISHDELETEFVRENWSKLFEACKDDNYQNNYLKSVFLSKYLNIFSSGKHEIIREMLKHEYYMKEDFFVSSINKSIDNIMTVIDVIVEDKSFDLLFKSREDGATNLFDSFFFNEDFAKFMEDKYNIKGSYPLLNKTGQDVEKILLDYDRFTMKLDIDDVKQEQVEISEVKPIRKASKIKKF